MNSVDILLIIPLIFGAINGFRKGLILEIASLVALAFGIYGALHFSDFTSYYLKDQINLSENALGLTSFALTFMLIVIGVHLLGKFLNKIIQLAALGLLNRLAGMLFGLTKFLLMLIVFLFLFETLNSKFNWVSSQSLSNSILYYPIIDIANPLKDWLISGDYTKMEIVNPLLP